MLLARVVAEKNINIVVVKTKYYIYLLVDPDYVGFGLLLPNRLYRVFSRCFSFLHF